MGLQMFSIDHYWQTLPYFKTLFLMTFPCDGHDNLYHITPEQDQIKSDIGIVWI